MAKKRRAHQLTVEPSIQDLENVSLKHEARESAQLARKASTVQEISYTCKGTLASHYLDIYQQVVDAVEDSPWAEMPVKPIRLHIKLAVDAMPGARANVADHLRSRYGIRLLEITFERGARV